MEGLEVVEIGSVFRNAKVNLNPPPGIQPIAAANNQMDICSVNENEAATICDLADKIDCALTREIVKKMAGNCTRTAQLN